MQCARDTNRLMRMGEKPILQGARQKQKYYIHFVCARDTNRLMRMGEKPILQGARQKQKYYIHFVCARLTVPVEKTIITEKKLV